MTHGGSGPPPSRWRQLLGGLDPPPQQVASALGGLSHIVLERARSDRYTVTMSDGPAICRPRDPLGAISCLWAVKSPASPAGLICAACMLLHTCLQT